MEIFSDLIISAASPVQNHRRDMSTLMNFLKADYVKPDKEQNMAEDEMRSGFDEHITAISTMEQKYLTDVESVFPFTLRRLLKNVEPDLVACMILTYS